MPLTFSVGDKQGLIELTPRLKLVAESLTRLNVTTIADIGTDHAKLPIYLIQNNKCQKVYASDIAEGPLNTARKNIESYGIKSSSISLYLSDGLNNIPKDYNAVSITGMGGLLIADILSSARSNIPFVLNPMSSSEDLRRYLYLNGWEILDEDIAIEDRRFYSVILCIKNDKYIKPDTFDCYYSEPLVRKYNTSEEVNKYINYSLNKLQQNYLHKIQSVKHKDDCTEIEEVLKKSELIFNKGE